MEGKLAVLEQALDHARPLDELSQLLTVAAGEFTIWADIDAVQETRRAITEVLEPMKGLRALVAAETASSIAGLSDTMSVICERIRLRENLSYEEAVVNRNEVDVIGSFSPGMRIDAALVASTSWLRAILWSFVFALRQETLEALGYNALPLVVLDDPQATFDPRNKRKWAQDLVRCANMPTTDLLNSQLILTTHERDFYQMMIAHEKFDAEEGHVGRVNESSGVATITNGARLQRIYDEATETNDDGKARDFISAVRVYCEDLLKFVLRGQDLKVPDSTLQQLQKLLTKLGQDHVAPFDRKPFKELVDGLNGGQKAVKYMNEAHHKSDESYGVAEAEVVKAYWDTNLLVRIDTAFMAFDEFELYTGEPRTFPWAKKVVEFPDGHAAKVKACRMQQTGVAAAAKTDGRAGDGVVTVREWTAGDEVVLPNHGVYQVAAGTLDPVAGIGDLIIVSNYAKINPRNLVVAVVGNSLLARRFNEPEQHPEIVVLTGQGVDPLTLPEPVIVQPDTPFRKIVGTLFAAHLTHLLPVPPLNPDREFVAVSDPNILDTMLKGTHLLKVEGRSAEPIALEGQYLMTRNQPVKAAAIASLNGRLVVGIDEDGARYFKRLRLHGKIAVLESLNPDGLTPGEVLSLDGSDARPMLIEALEVIGVLFELPDAEVAAIAT